MILDDTKLKYVNYKIPIYLQKRAKLEAKMEKKKAREAEEQMREIKKKKDEELEQERKKIEEKQEVKLYETYLYLYIIHNFKPD